MAPDNWEKTLRAFQRRVPFHPFTVELSSGSKIEVDHPEALVMRGGTAVYLGPDGDLTLFDHHAVACVSDESERSKTSSN